MNKQLLIRTGRNSLAFAIAEYGNQDEVAYEPYVVKSGMSIAANLREAFRTRNLGQGDIRRVQVMVDVPWVLVPIQEAGVTGDYYEQIFRYTMGEQGGEVDQRVVMHNELSDLNAVVLFAVSRDLKLVVGDNFEEMSFRHAMSSVWEQMHRLSYTGHFRKLFAYEHDGRLDVFSFDRSRFHYANAFDVEHEGDATFYLMSVWQQLGMSQTDDELILVQGDEARGTRYELRDDLRRFVEKVEVRVIDVG